MDRRTLGGQGLEVSAEGLGCMGMTHAYGTGDEQSGLQTIHRALELGITFLDTAEVYGPYTNEQLVGRAIAGRRDEFEIATKFGFAIDPEHPADRGVDGTPQNVKRAVVVEITDRHSSSGQLTLKDRPALTADVLKSLAGILKKQQRLFEHHIRFDFLDHVIGISVHDK